jgi:hypothetical protein
MEKIKIGHPLIHRTKLEKVRIETSPFYGLRKCLIQFLARDKHQTLNGRAVLDIVVGMECANILLR